MKEWYIFHNQGCKQSVKHGEIFRVCNTELYDPLVLNKCMHFASQKFSHTIIIIMSLFEMSKTFPNLVMLSLPEYPCT